jgi:hypothetical protein
MMGVPWGGNSSFSGDKDVCLTTEEIALIEKHTEPYRALFGYYA